MRARYATKYGYYVVLENEVYAITGRIIFHGQVLNPEYLTLGKRLVIILNRLTLGSLFECYNALKLFC